MDQLNMDLPPRRPRSRADQIKARFITFHQGNPWVWEYFLKYTFEVVTAGFQHFSVDMIWQRLRWYVSMETTPRKAVKLNDHYRAYYARMFEAKFPQHAGFFRNRVRTSENRAAYDTDIEVFKDAPAGDEDDLMNELRGL